MERSDTRQEFDLLRGDSSQVRRSAKTRAARLAIADIDRSDMRFQFRLCFKTDDLVDSIREHGQHTPVLLWGQAAPYVVIDGFRRLEVLVQLEQTHVNALIEENLSESQAASLSFSANVRRKNLSPYDKASVIWCALNRWGLTQNEVAKAFNLSRRQIERYASLLKFEEPLVQGVCEGRITMAHAVCLHQAKVENLDRWVKDVACRELSALELRKQLRGLRRRRSTTYLVRDPSGFRLRSIRFRHDMSFAERRKIAGALESALRTAAESLYWEARKERERMRPVSGQRTTGTG
jgi:ParB/RepB/Spo0J family partition protein